MINQCTLINKRKLNFLRSLRRRVKTTAIRNGAETNGSNLSAGESAASAATAQDASAKPPSSSSLRTLVACGDVQKRSRIYNGREAAFSGTRQGWGYTSEDGGIASGSNCRCRWSGLSGDWWRKPSVLWTSAGIQRLRSFSESLENACDLLLPATRTARKIWKGKREKKCWKSCQKQRRFRSSRCAEAALFIWHAADVLHMDTCQTPGQGSKVCMNTIIHSHDSTAAPDSPALQRSMLISSLQICCNGNRHATVTSHYSRTGLRT